MDPRPEPFQQYRRQKRRGAVRTIDDQAKAHGISPERAAKEVILAPQPTREFVKVEEIAAMAVYLASDAAAQINGAMFSIDGGWTAR